MKLLAVFISLIIFCTYSIAQQPQLILPIGHTAEIRSAEFSPDGKKVIAQSNDNTIKIWDAQSGKLLINFIDFFQENTYDHTSAVASPDGKRLVTGFLDIIATVWDTQTGRSLFNLEGHKDLIGYIVYSPNGKKIVTKSNDQTAIIWDAQTGKRLFTLNGLPEELEDYTVVDFSPDSKKILVSLGYESDQVWDVNTGKKLYELDGFSSFSPDSKTILTANTDSTVTISDAQNLKILQPLKGYKKKVYSAEFSPDGTKILTASQDSTAKIWDTKTGKLLHTLSGNTREVYSAEFSPDGEKILTTSGDSITKVWDTRSGILLYGIHTDSTFIVSSPVFSSDSRTIVTTSGNHSVTILDASTGKILKTLYGHSADVSEAVFSPDNKKLLTVSYDKTIKIWDTQTGEILADLKGHTSAFSLVQYSTDGKYIITSAGDSNRWNSDRGFYDLVEDIKKWDIWDAQTGKLLPDLKKLPTIFNPSMPYSYREGYHEPKGSILLLDLERPTLGNKLYVETRDGKKIITVGNAWSGGKVDTAHIWNTVTGTLSASLINPSDNFIAAVFSPDGKKILTSSSYTKAKVWDAETGKLLTPLKDLPDDIETAIFSLDGKRLFTASVTGDANIWDTKTGTSLAELYGHFNRINSAVFSPDGKYIVTTSEDNTNKKWNAETGKLLYTFFKIDSTDYLLIDKDGHYSGTPAASKYLSWKKGKNVYDFDQWDIQYNRPDKVLRALGNTDTMLINSFHTAWQKRIDRLKVDTTKFRKDNHVPEAIITNSENIVGTNNNKIILKIRLYETDKTAYLSKIYITINDNPLLGSFGKDISNRKLSDTTFSFPVSLSTGKNHIKVSCLNNRSAESLRQSVYMRYESDQEDTIKPRTYFIGIGENHYVNDTSRNLSFAEKDIQDLNSLFRARDSSTVSRILIDSFVTKKNILALKDLLNKTNIDDKVIIALSGHGLLYQRKDFYFGTYNIDFDDPRDEGLKYEELESLLDDIPARNKLLLIDACHSGEVDTSLSTKIFPPDRISTVPVPKDTTRKKGDPDEEIKTSLGLDNSFELMKELFADLSRGNGAVVISAARGLGFAEEDPTWSNGAFTLCFKAAFLGNDKFPELKETADKNGDGVSINELKEYILTKVPLLTNDRQKPTTRRENIEVDWKLW